jgi:hypothetical protein
MHNKYYLGITFEFKLEFYNSSYIRLLILKFL